MQEPASSSSSSNGNTNQASHHEASSGRQITNLHPLAIVTICDHCTRVKVGGSQQAPDSRILGILFGVQDGLQVSITDAFELQYEAVDGVIKIPSAYVNEKKDLYSAVNQGSEVMGWYSVGTDIRPGDLEIHRAMTEWNESPIFLLLNPMGSTEGAKDLPMALYESELHLVNDVPTLIFVSVPFQLETAEAERISVEHVVKAAPTEGESSIDLHVEGIKTSLQALVSRIQIILRLLQAIKEGKIAPDYRLLRQIACMCNQLPVAAPAAAAAASSGEGEDFTSAFLGEYNDSLVVTYLASISKLSSLSNEVSEKFSMAFGSGGGDRHRPRHR